MDHSAGTENKKQSRREERKEAFLFLFESLFRDGPIDDAYIDAAEARGVEAGEYTRNLVEGVLAHSDEIDGLIEVNLKGWTKRRISRVSLTLLRIAVYEILYVDGVPDSVSVNEAVELSKEYSPEKENAFVNGVLRSVVRQVKESGEK